MYQDVSRPWHLNNPFWKRSDLIDHRRIHGSTYNCSHLVEFGNLDICLNLGVDVVKVFVTTRFLGRTENSSIFWRWLSSSCVALCMVFPHLQGYDVIASPLQRPRRSLASVLADLSCLHQVRVMLVGLEVVNGRLTQQAQQFSSSYTTCLRTAQPRMAATKRRAKLSMKWRVSKGYVIRIHSITSAAGFQQISQCWRLKWCLNYYIIDRGSMRKQLLNVWIRCVRHACSSREFHYQSADFGWFQGHERPKIMKSWMGGKLFFWNCTPYTECWN